MEKVSIIVPVYNVQKYLKECIESILRSTYTNIELILVNDGSTDDSGKICKEYLKRDERIKFIDQENHGLGSARNTGLKNVTGSYIMFVDSDDYLPNSAVQIMYEKISQKNADVVTANYINTNDDGEPWESPIFDKEKFRNMKISIKDYDKSFYVMNSSVCNKIFKTSFLKKYNLWFEIGVPAEDAIFSMKCLNYSDNIYYINDVMYYYRQRNVKKKKQLSISNNCSLKYFDGINKAYNIIYNVFNDNQNLAFYRYFYAKSATYILSKFIDSKLVKDEERKIILDKMFWFYNLSIALKVPMCNDRLEEIIEKINNKNYCEAIHLCKIVAKERDEMTQEELLKQSKPTFEFYRKISENDKEFEIR